VRRSGGKKSRRSSVSEENKAIIRQLIEQLFNTGNQEIADGVLAADYVDHSPSHPGLPGPENLKRAVSEWRVAFPDTRNVIEDIVAEGDWVAVRWTTRATHQDEFMGIAATGNQIAVTSFCIFRLSGGKIVESWDTFHVVEMMQQLGVNHLPGL
jgi:predicted ester cyclase